jgi:glycosyltransferase involved in cell wall biosynthesis
MILPLEVSAPAADLPFPRVLLCHNYYQQPGGEDRVFADEAGLLAAHGHKVTRFTAHNDDIAKMDRIAVAVRTVWSRASYARLRALIRAERPDILHCTNSFPLLSPAIYYAARAERVPVVQTLQNYRLLCPSAVLHRDGRVCEECLGRMVPWPGVLHGCYRGSRAGTAAVATMLITHRLRRTWTKAVDRYVVPTEFMRRKFIEGGLPPQKIAVKPNFVDPDPGPGTGQGGYAAFVGRLSAEKGIDTLLAAWAQAGVSLPLKILGDGPLAPRVQQAAAQSACIQWLGQRTLEEVQQAMGEAACVVVPSTWFEGFPKIIVEAFAKGTPVIAARLGSMAEVVDDGRTGLHFQPGDAASLAAAVAQLTADPAKLAAMRRAARREYEEKYTAQINYEHLMHLYRQAAAGRAQGLPATNGKRELEPSGIRLDGVGRA